MSNTFPLAIVPHSLDWIANVNRSNWNIALKYVCAWAKNLQLQFELRSQRLRTWFVYLEKFIESQTISDILSNRFYDSVFSLSFRFASLSFCNWFTIFLPLFPLLRMFASYFTCFHIFLRHRHQLTFLFPIIISVFVAHTILFFSPLALTYIFRILLCLHLFTKHFIAAITWVYCDFLALSITLFHIDRVQSFSFFFLFIALFRVDDDFFSASFFHDSISCSKWWWR